MASKLTWLILLIGTVALFSCGVSKKTLKAQIADLQTKNARCSADSQQLATNVASLQKQVGDLTSQNKAVNDQMASMKKDCDACQAQLKEVNATLDEFQDNVDKLMEKIKAAEEEFSSKGMAVYSKDGIIHVDMEDNLLYKSGSATISPAGKQSLAKLASVLNEMPNLKVIVVGNTDSIAHKKGGGRDNWKLSTERGTGVVKVLQANGVDPARLTAAGKGQYNAVSDNSTAEGRAKNRRTEIVLNPNWEKLWESVKKE